ncbi:hypothetical protein Tco_0106057 [Tanacetum coccineum]
MQSIRGQLRPTECKASEGNKDLLSTKHQRLIKGLADGKASASNLRDIKVKDIVKEVEDYLKTYSPAEMDIRCGLKRASKILGGKFYKAKAWGQMTL